jgi:hypothetical protein
MSEQQQADTQAHAERDQLLSTIDGGADNRAGGMGVGGWLSKVMLIVVSIASLTLIANTLCS